MSNTTTAEAAASTERWAPALKSFEASNPVSNILQAAPPSVATLVEEVAAGARRVAQTQILPAAVGTVEVGGQSAWVAVEAAGARRT